MEDVQWINIPGFPNYKINKNGDVLSSAYTKPRILIKKKKYGYLIVNLHKNGHCKTVSVHRLVAAAFIPNINNKPFVNHKNGIKTDNRMENLEWVTHDENMKHASAMGLMPIGFRNKSTKLSDSDVNKIRLIGTSMPLRHIAKMFNVSHRSILSILKMEQRLYVKSDNN
jgi:HNH endonuclease